MHDLEKHVKIGRLQCYADDTILYLQGDSPEDVIKSLEEQSVDVFEYFARNELVANPDKTAFLLFGPKKRSEIDPRYSIMLGKDTNVMESEDERILGVQVHRSLQWKCHLEKVKKKLNYGITTLKRLQGLMRRNHLKQLADCLVMSHIRYTLPVYLTQFVRIKSEDPTKHELVSLQGKMNDMMRIILNIKRRDKISIKTMLKKCGMISVNQMICKAVLMEAWKAQKFDIESIVEAFQSRKSKRFENCFKATTDPRSFVSVASKLWEQSTVRFKDTTLIKVAKEEAENLVKIMPV